MIKIKQAVIVEGKYDKIKLSNILDTMIITTDGFGIFNDEKRREFIKSVAAKRGIIVLTDSDGAGKVIRSHIKNITGNENVTCLYVPQLKGKEKRKKKASKEGFLGVEGISDDVLKELFERFSIKYACVENKKEITKSRLFADGLSGGENSSAKRSKILSHLGLPPDLSGNAFCEALNTFLEYEEYEKIIKQLFGENNA